MVVRLVQKRVAWLVDVKDSLLVGTKVEWKDEHSAELLVGWMAAQLEDSLVESTVMMSAKSMVERKAVQSGSRLGVKLVVEWIVWRVSWTAAMKGSMKVG